MLPEIKATKSSCEWEPPLSINQKSNKSRIIRHKEGFRWSSVKADKYKKEGQSWSSVIRMALIGDFGESVKFSLRYFEILPKGYSSLEKHKHEHVVICIRGRGKVTLDKKTYKVGYLDTVYISPDTIHQFLNPFEEPFGFFCIVDKKRDKPIVIEEKND